MVKVADLTGTSQVTYQIGLNGPKVKNASGTVEIRNAADAAYADIVAEILRAASNQLILNNDAAGAGADWLMTIERPSTGQTEALTLRLPGPTPSPGQVLSVATAAGGLVTLEWVTSSSASNALKADTTSLAFGSGATVAMFSLPAAAIVRDIFCIVDTAFDGTPTASVGISGSASKYMPATSLDLTDAGSYSWHPNLTAQGAESLEIAYAAGGATVGAARFLVYYTEPS